MLGSLRSGTGEEGRRSYPRQTFRGPGAPFESLGKEHRDRTLGSVRRVGVTGIKVEVPDGKSSLRRLNLE